MGEDYPIKSDVVSLESVLCGKYRIPIYQRPYEWGEKNIDDFLESIFNGYEDSKPIFFGTIQFNKEDENIEILDIVDGQQRLTTFLLYIYVLKNKNDERDIEDYDFNFIPNDYKELLKSYVTKNLNVKDSNNKYIDNMIMLEKKTLEYLKDINCEEKNFFGTLKNYIRKKVYFVQLITEGIELSDVVSVFNTINTTGLDLNAVDIFKFRYYDYLRRNYSNETQWMEKIDECYKHIDEKNVDLRPDQSKIEMSWILDVYKHIICANEYWGFSEVSKSNIQFYEDLYKNKTKKVKDEELLEFEVFKNVVELFVDYYRWIENRIYNYNDDDEKKDKMDLFSINLIEKTRYSRYWTIPFIVAFFKCDNNEKKEELYKESLHVSLQMFKFFTIYTVINDKVINAIQNKVCKGCFSWFKDNSIDEINKKISEMMWEKIRWKEDKPREFFDEIISENLFDNGKRTHLICTLSALLDEIEHNTETKRIREILFDWINAKYDIDHIYPREKFKDEDDKGKFNGIGNLVVLERSINRSIKDNDIKDKKIAYSKSNYCSVKDEIVKDDIAKDEVWKNKNAIKNAIMNRNKKELGKIHKFIDERSVK